MSSTAQHRRGERRPSTVERAYATWRTYYEGHRTRLRRTLPGELVVRSIDLKLPSRATVLSTQQVACLAPLAVGVMAMVHPSSRANLGRILGGLLGLDPAADDSLAALFTSTQSIAASTGVVGLLFLLGWAAGVPGYIQRLLEDIWSLPSRGIAASLPGQVNWFLGFGAGALVVGLLPVWLYRHHWLRHERGDLIALLAITLMFFAVELWSDYILLARRIELRRLLLPALLSTVSVDAVLLALHWMASWAINSTVDQFGLIAITFLAQASAVMIAGAMLFGELLGAEIDRRRRPELWPDDVVEHDQDVAENPKSFTPPTTNQP